MHTLTIRIVDVDKRPNTRPIFDFRVHIRPGRAKHSRVLCVVRWLAEYAITMGLAFLAAYFILEVRL